MATAAITVTKRVCDRPNCGNTVTDRGGRFSLDAGKGPHDMTSFLASPIVMPVPDQVIRDCTNALSVDLCRSCAESLRTWWSAVERRAAAKEGASQ